MILFIILKIITREEVQPGVPGHCFPSESARRESACFLVCSLRGMGRKAPLIISRSDPKKWVATPSAEKGVSKNFLPDEAIQFKPKKQPCAHSIKYWFTHSRQKYHSRQVLFLFAWWQWVFYPDRLGFKDFSPTVFARRYSTSQTDYLWLPRGSLI